VLLDEIGSAVQAASVAAAILASINPVGEQAQEISWRQAGVDPRRSSSAGS